MSETKFLHYLKVVAVIHLAVVIVIVFSGGCSELFARRKKITVMPVEFLVAVPPQSDSRSSDIVSEPVRERAPVTKPLKKPEKHAVKVNNQRVIRQAGSSKPVQNLLSPEEIERRLRMGAKAGDRNTPIPDGDMLGFTIIKQTLYDAWSPPDKEEAGEATAEISVKIAGDGTLYDRKMDRASGNAGLDASVMQAINSVQRIYGLNTEFLNKYADKRITVAFKVE